MKATIISSRDVAKYGRLDPGFYLALEAARNGILPDVPETLEEWLALRPEDRQLVMAAWVAYAEQLRLQRTASW